MPHAEAERLIREFARRDVKTDVAEMPSRRAGTLGEDVEVLAKLVAELGERLERLAGKLAPVLVPAHPEAGSLVQACGGAIPHRCPMSGRVHELTDCVGIMNSQVDELIGRVAL